MVSTRGGSRLRPRVRFSTPEREEQDSVPAPNPAPVPAPVPEAVPEEPQGFRTYQTRMGPRAPSPIPQRRSRRARPSKRARTSGPGSPHPLGHSRRLLHQLQRRHLHHSYPQPRGSGGPYSSGILSRGMSGYTREIFMESHTMTSRH